MRSALLLSVVLSGVTATACTSSRTTPLHYSSHFDVSPLELLPLAASAVRDSGYTVTPLGENAAFVAVAPDRTPLLVEIATPRRTAVAFPACNAACQTTFSVTPLAQVGDGKFMLRTEVDATVQDQARVVLGVIEDRTMGERHVQMF